MNNRSLRTAALAALALFATTAAHAQGLGGVLNQAKAKVSQAASAGASPSRATAAAAQATDYQLPANLPNDPSIAEMEEYARAMLADPRPVPKEHFGDSSDGNQWYRRLTRNEGYPLKFTWDHAAMVNFKDKHSGLFPYIENFCEGLVAQLAPYTARHAQLGAALRKVKEIHMSCVPKPEKKGEPGEESNWFFSFSPATGVLTATMPGSETYGGPAAITDASLAKWIISHVR